MNKKIKELAKRLVEHPKWRWSAGMATFNPNLPQSWYPRVGDERIPRYSFLLPDISDNATAGILLSMLGEDPWLKITVWHSPKAWGVWSVGLGSRPYEDPFVGDTLGEACAQALLAAWKRGEE